MEADQLPYINPALITWLEERFRNILPPNPVSSDELSRMIGQQDVIRVIREVEALQNQNQ